jgi:hypothetical protein
MPPTPTHDTLRSAHSHRSLPRLRMDVCRALATTSRACPRVNPTPATIPARHLRASDRLSRPRSPLYCARPRDMEGESPNLTVCARLHLCPRVNPAPATREQSPSLRMPRMDDCAGSAPPSEGESPNLAAIPARHLRASGRFSRPRSPLCCLRPRDMEGESPNLAVYACLHLRASGRLSLPRSPLCCPHPWDMEGESPNLAVCVRLPRSTLLAPPCRPRTGQQVYPLSSLHHADPAPATTRIHSALHGRVRSAPTLTGLSMEGPRGSMEGLTRHHSINPNRSCNNLPSKIPGQVSIDGTYSVR